MGRGFDLGARFREFSVSIVIRDTGVCALKFKDSKPMLAFPLRLVICHLALRKPNGEVFRSDAGKAPC